MQDTGKEKAGIVSNVFKNVPFLTSIKMSPQWDAKGLAPCGHTRELGSGAFLDAGFARKRGSGLGIFESGVRSTGAEHCSESVLGFLKELV